MPTSHALRYWPFLVLLALISSAAGEPAARPLNPNRYAYLDEPCDPYYVNRNFPKLITPQWVGEEGVDAVVVLAIDDMRDTAKYEKWLRPVLDRLKKIDGRAPVSIMSCRVEPSDPQLAAWLKEGLSIECHTYDHPCPILGMKPATRPATNAVVELPVRRPPGDVDFLSRYVFFPGEEPIELAKSTYDHCVDLISQIAGNKPVAFRTPCCDSRNTVSPRLFTEIIGKKSLNGRFLTIDSSVFNILTPNDPELPRELVQNADGTERFRRYLPFKNFVNTIEDYPYPYLINNQIWEFPCVVPSDWEAQNIQKPFNPRTLEDWKANLDAIVIKKGVFTAVFHPHGWIKPEQVAEFVDYADKKYGKRVKFLNFRECQERIDKNMLLGNPIRSPKEGKDNGVRVLDLNNDGYLDVLIGNADRRVTRLYSPAIGGWIDVRLPVSFVDHDHYTLASSFGAVGPQREVGFATKANAACWYFDGDRWRTSDFLEGMDDIGEIAPNQLRILDVNGDGKPEIIANCFGKCSLYEWSKNNKRWTSRHVMRQDVQLDVSGSFRFADINGDGRLDLIMTNDAREAIYLYDVEPQTGASGWIKKAFDTADTKPRGMLPIERKDGTNNGFFVRDGALCWINEDTAKNPDLIVKLDFNVLLAAGGADGGDKDIPAGKTPEESFNCLKPRPGFQVQLVAKEPLVEDPIAFAFGADGKLWVVEMGDYPLGIDGKGKPGGKVKILEDTDGDGVYDKATVFLEGLNFPTGVTPWKKGVIVTAAPDIFYAEDTDGDGKADKREVLFTGFVEGNQQHRINGLVMGLDNWFYGANGHSNGVVKSVKTGKTVDIRNRDFRIRPESGEIETVSGPTQFGRARDDWDNWFGNDNSHPFFQFPLEEHYLQRNPYVTAPAGRMEVPDVPGPSQVYPISRTLTRFNDFAMANHFTSANSAIVYRDDLFDPFSNSVFVSEPVHNLVSRQVLRTEGTRFHSSRAPDEQDREFLASSDNWFRPTMLKTGPDGALWIADMYRLVIEHPQWIPKEWQEKLDLRAGHDMGRIYRVWPVGVTPRKMPRLNKMTVGELVDALDSPSGWQRDMAQQLLVERQNKSAGWVLEKFIEGFKHPEARVHALYTLDGLKALTPEILVAALKDAHPGVRRHAVRLSETLLDSHDEILKQVAALANDPDPFVRLQVAYSLGECKAPVAGEALTKLLIQSGDDAILQTAAMSSLKPENLTAVLKAIGNDPAATPSPALVASLTRMALGAKNLQAVSALAVSLVGTEKEKELFAPWRFHSVGALLDAVTTAYPNEKSVSQLLLTTHSPEAQSACVRLDRIHEVAVRTAMDARAPEENRSAALTLLGRGNFDARDREQVVKLFDPTVPSSVQSAAVAAVARSRDATAADTLLAAWKKSTPTVRAAILDAMLARQAWATALLDVVEKGQIKVTDIDPARRQSMLKSKTAAIHDRAEKIFAAAVNPDRQKVIDGLREKVLAAKADANHGMEIFTKTCAACHQVAGPAVAPGTLGKAPGVIGNAVGPDLASVGDKSPDGLLVAILDPNRAVEPRFVSYVIDTKAGDTLTGLLSTESGNAITLLSPDGKSQQILRTDIKELRSTGLSLMPEGLESGLVAQDIADLIAFVQTAKPVGR